VIFYADVVTESIRRTLEVTKYRREKQIAHNLENGITPVGVKRGIQASLHDKESTRERDAAIIAEPGADEDVAPVIAQLETEMQEAAEALEFERAALLRDQINALRSGDFRKPKGTGGRSYRKGKQHRH
jgi:excinuclease ABC subunit B